MLDVGCKPLKSAILLCLSCVQVWTRQLRAPADELEKNSSMFEWRAARVGQESTFPSCENVCFSGAGKEGHWLSSFLKMNLRLLWVWPYGATVPAFCYFCPSDPPPRQFDPALMGSHILTQQLSFSMHYSTEQTILTSCFSGYLHSNSHSLDLIRNELLDWLLDRKFDFSTHAPGFPFVLFP